MTRLATAAAIVLFLSAGALGAAEVKGKLTSVDADKGTLTITVDGKDRDFTVPKDAEITVQDIRAYKSKEGLKDKAFVKGRMVVVTTEKKDDKEVVTKVAIYTGRKG
jgi:hypothetical protein